VVSGGDNIGKEMQNQVRLGNKRKGRTGLRISKRCWSQCGDKQAWFVDWENKQRINRYGRTGRKKKIHSTQSYRGGKGT